MSTMLLVPLRSLLTAGVCFAIAGAAAAQAPIERDPVAMLKRADTDGDGKVNLEEFIKARTADLEAAFGRIDADGDGKIDESEAKAAAERMRSLGAGGREGFRRPEGMRDFMQRGGGRPGMPDRGGRGSEKGFRRPPSQD